MYTWFNVCICTCVYTYRLTSMSVRSACWAGRSMANAREAPEMLSKQCTKITIIIIVITICIIVNHSNNYR